MTPEQHRWIANLLGYPKCCVEEWIAGDPGRGHTHGVCGRRRDPAESAALDAEISAYLGREWTGATTDPYVRFVACATTCPNALALIQEVDYECHAA